MDTGDQVPVPLGELATYLSNVTAATTAAPREEMKEQTQ
jgi:hypothetical protein